MMQSRSVLDLPGFRFHPTEEELLDFYLRRMVGGKKLNLDIIATLNIYRHDPWDLPKMAKIGEREWYFFVPRDKKHPNSRRPNRTTERGFWKATGSDRSIRSVVDPKRIIGLKKTLVFYLGRAPRGCKTEWIMNEYRLPNASSSLKEETVLCKVYQKATSLRELDQKAAKEEETSVAPAGYISMADSVASSPDHNNLWYPLPSIEADTLKVEELLEQIEAPTNTFQSVNHPELHVPKHSMEWMQDTFLAQLMHSPWLEPLSPGSNIGNF